jgi:hypothetical protein
MAWCLKGAALAQAAMLDAGITVTLGQLLARLLPALSDAAKAMEAAALTTMVLEIITVLCNLDICLNPAVRPEQRALEDCIAPSEVSPVMSGSYTLTMSADGCSQAIDEGVQGI